MANHRGPQTTRYEKLLQDLEEEEEEEVEEPENAAEASGMPSPQRKNYVATAFGRVVNPLMQVLDVNGMMGKIDINHVMSRVNWNDVIDDIEWNNLMERVDLDALVNRIDVNAVVERIDVNTVIERSNLKSIIARSTSGICFLALDTIRAMCIKADQIMQRWGRCADCAWWRSDYKKWVLPPLPTVTPIRQKKERHEDRKLRVKMECPTKSTHLAIAVQGRNAGVCTRFLAFAIDKGLTIGFAFLFIVIMARLVELATPESPTVHTNTDGLVNNQAANELIAKELQAGNVTLLQLKEYFDERDAQVAEVTQQQQILLVVGLPVLIVCTLGFVTDAFFLAIIGRTIGKIIMGLVVLDSKGGRIGHLTIYQAILRSFMTNAGLFTVMGAFVSMGREDRRGIIDLICSTTVVYAWDAKRFRLAEDDIARDMPFGDLDSSESKSDGIGGSNTEKLPYLRRKSWSSRKTKEKNKTATFMITVPEGSMSDYQGRRANSKTFDA